MKKDYVSHEQIYTSGEYLANNDTWHAEDSPWKAKQIYKLLVNNNVKPKTICEIGCGIGEILVQLTKLLENDTIKYTGYDITQQLSEHWKARTSESLTFICKDILTEDCFFDVMCYIDVIEHIEDYIGFLKKIKDKSNYKVFAFPLEITAVKAILSKYYISSNEKYGHIHFFNKDIVQTMMKNLGFTIVDSFLAPSAIQLAGKSTSVSRPSSLLRIPRILLSKISIEFTQNLLGGYTYYILAK